MQQHRQSPCVSISIMPQCLFFQPSYETKAAQHSTSSSAGFLKRVVVTSWSNDSPYWHWVATLSSGFTLSNVVLPNMSKTIKSASSGKPRIQYTQCKTTRYCVVLVVETRLQLRDQEKVLKPVLQDTQAEIRLKLQIQEMVTFKNQAYLYGNISSSVEVGTHSPFRGGFVQLLNFFNWYLRALINVRRKDLELGNE